MPNTIALLRGINVGGRNIVPMAELRDLIESLGFTDVKSLLQSGNVVFQNEGRSSSDLERILEEQTEKRFKFKIDYVVRSLAEWDDLIEGNPFKSEAETNPGHLVATLTKGVIEPSKFEALRAAIKGSEIAHLGSSHLYITYPDGIGESKLTNALLESKLGLRCTARNWNTVLKLAALARG